MWLYHLHYLHDLNAQNSGNRLKINQLLIESWIKNNPPKTGVAWEPYPLSLRIVNLVKWFSKHNEIIKKEFLISLEFQTQALMQQIEYHILGNHLFVNAKALVFSGAYLDGSEAEGWLDKGLAILDNEIKEQFLNDGGHFELSPMYHSNLLWDLCDLVHLSQITGIKKLQDQEVTWLQLIKAGLAWLEVMTHPDGNISFFNDAAFEISPCLSELTNYAWQLGINSHGTKLSSLCLNYLNSSGYYAINWGEDSKLIIDIAKVGADYQPGHAHADTLSFELSLFKQRFLVNTGTSQYGLGGRRDYERSTLAHNTVCVNNQNSSDVWSGFRVGQRAFPKELVIQNDNSTVVIKAAHNGYEHQANKITHTREWSCKLNQLVIKDQLTGSFQSAIARFHFHPEVTITPVNENLLQCRLGDSQVVLLKIFDTNQWYLENTFWSPKFGVQQENQCLNILFSGLSVMVEITW